MKPNCYQCKFRGEVPGSAHSKCVLDSELNEIALTILAVHVFELGSNFKNIKLHPHGVKNGWAMWPANFDPVWVEECKFFEQKA